MLAATAFLMVVSLGCNRTSDSEGIAAPQVPLVEAISARAGALPIEETMPGVVRARNQVAIRPETAGRIVEVLARMGEAVKRGQILVRLDDSEARERLRQAEADVRLAEAGAAAAKAREAELEARVARTRALAEQELISAQALETLEAQLDAARASADEAAARVEQARAAVEERRSALAKTVIRAPVAGRLGDRRAEVGMLVDPSNVLFVVGDLGELIIEVNLTEATLARVDEGLPVVIESRGITGGPVRAELSRISPFLAEESFTTLAEIDLDNPERWLKPGMFVTVRILVGESQQSTLVPLSAVWEDPASGERGVFVIEESSGLEEPSGITTADSDEPRTAVFRRVEVLAEGRSAAGVSGIEEGTWVVTVGQHLLAAELRAAAELAEAASGSGWLTGLTTAAKVRPVSWERVLELQDLQDEDLLEGFLDKQRTVAAALGAEIPESEDVVDRVLEEASSGAVQP
jgi:RND family efflux transporter MFP subunit